MIFENDAIIKIVVALFLGALIGLEREIKHKPAGLRTHALVSIGACLFTIISINSFPGDSARVASGIVTGIGFIGAGAIIASRGHVHGITTAASLWVTASIGLAIGAGNYLLSIITSIIIFLILMFGSVEKELEKKK